MNTGLLKALNQRPIAYYPLYRNIAGSLSGAILLSQLMYWLCKKDKIYKTDADIMKETGLTENELRGAKKKIKQIPFLTVSVEGVPAKTFYEIDWIEYEKTATKSENSSFVKLTKLGSLNSPTCNSEIHGTITETTAETTTETTLSIMSEGSDETVEGLASQPAEKPAQTPPSCARPPFELCADYSSHKPAGAKRKAWDYTSDFLDWYNEYPRHVKKGDAFKAWNQVSKVRPPIDELLEITKKHKSAWEAENRKQNYIPHPATWLRAFSWDDEICSNKTNGSLSFDADTVSNEILMARDKVNGMRKAR